MPKTPIYIKKDLVINTASLPKHTQSQLILLLQKFNDNHFFFRDTQSEPSAYQFVSITKKRKFLFFAKTEYRTTYNIKLTNTLLKYQRRKDPSEYRWAVIGDEIGHGSQGSVHNIIATLYIKNNALIRKEKSTRIVKLMLPSNISLNNYTNRNSADHEYKMMNRLPFIYHPHLVIHDFYNDLDALISRRFKNFDLHTLLFKIDQTGNLVFLDKLSFAEKLKLCQLLLNELKTLHDAGIIHRDIKPENIIVELTNENTIASVNIIDLGLAKESSIKTDGITQPGTRIYASPELFALNSANKPADIFALGRIFWMIFGCHKTIFQFLDDKNIQSLTINGCMPKQRDLFRNSILDSEIQDKLYALFLRMNHRNPRERASIPFCLEQLDTLSLSANISANPQITKSPSLFFKSPVAAPVERYKEEKGKQRLSPT